MIHIRVIRHSLRHLNLFSKEESIERIQCLLYTIVFFCFQIKLRMHQAYPTLEYAGVPNSTL